MPGHKNTDKELDNTFKPQGVTVSFKVPTEASPLPLKLNVQEEVVGTSTTCTRTACSSMDQYIEKDKNEIGDETNDDICLEREEDITEDLK